MTRRWKIACLCVAWLAGASAGASELSYTFVDFWYADQTVDAAGTQEPVAGQIVSVESEQGDGIAAGGSLGLGKRFFVAGSFVSSIVDFTATVSNPLVDVTIEDNYDLNESQLSFGYVQAIGDSFDLILEATYDSAEYDFGSLAGENFDVKESGAGGRIGFRWNPTRAIEVYGFSHYSPVGEVSLDRIEFDSEVVNRAGLIWYCFEDLGVGLDYRSGQIETVSVSIRFSFGTLQW